VNLELVEQDELEALAEPLPPAVAVSAERARLLASHLRHSRP
jgi:hypothetical protein